MPSKIKKHHIILIIIGIIVAAMGVVLFFIPPALFPDPANGFNVLRCMQLGGSFNVFSAPDQSDIAQNYDEFITWWSPGQYLVPYFFKLIIPVNLGQATAIGVASGQLCGLAGFYCFFKKVGFSPLISTFSLVFITIQLAFFVPYVFYNGGEVLLFAFEGWFLYGCMVLQKTGWRLVLFVLLSGWIGFFCKSSFIWIYAAGLCCLWIRLSLPLRGTFNWIKRGSWVGIPAVISLAVIYFFFLSKGESPASVSKGFRVIAETFSFPLAAPLLSGFSLDDFFHGLIYNFGNAMFSHQWAVTILFIIAVFSLLLIWCIVRYVPNRNYRLFVIVFYWGAVLFFSIVFLRQLNISYEARHFRIIGLLTAPGVIYLVSRLKRGFQLLFVVFCLFAASFGFQYLVKGYHINHSMSAKGVTGLSQINIDQPALSAVMRLDSGNRNATFVFVANDIGLEVIHNRVISLPAITGNEIDMADYNYDGFSGPLYIILPNSYDGVKSETILKAFTGYGGFSRLVLSNRYVLYSCAIKK